ncbi:hypothetical protein Ssi03_12820 [Sphaerisporangium siamense]|uniref:DUF3168 domain-containing protein n=1 Tax=Sphaerisporangium siamense TaxID=795645 RepID=A0A7W7DAF1_9ACTN|nr:hypothetical protein [Sphaerisporangium siamense]MBB4702949.1 hypothetical protein [Sphaerisporangium siamense]GII83292.1 hypothetical protein Ssi03_12820 [Sphaerisporangium siamense]
MIPDPEKTIIAALEHYMPDLVTQGVSRVFSQAQKNWDRQDFLVVRATGGGASRHPHLWAVCYFEIEAFASQRGNASLLARRAGASMSQASREGFRYATPETAGYLFGFREVNAPSLIYDGLSSKHGDTFMFQGTYQISIRPLR